QARNTIKPNNRLSLVASSSAELYKMAGKLWIYCADIGSVKTGRFGWCGDSEDGEMMFGDSIDELAGTVAKKVTNGAKVALGFECPLYVPLRDEPMLLTKSRTGEGNRSWSAGAGCGALATGLVEVAWLLGKIRANTPETAAVFLNWKAFENAEGGLFLWEAFVSGKAKGSGHAHDAEIAVQSFRAALPKPDLANAISEENVLSLVGASIVRTGWSADVQYLSEMCLVIKA
ncbi:MAG TPA: hypothetical protein VF208_08895, partial [Candidatus Binatia bacterium]